METREEILRLLSNIREDNHGNYLFDEIVAESLIALKENSQLTISEALNRGFNEWVK